MQLFRGLVHSMLFLESVRKGNSEVVARYPTEHDETEKRADTTVEREGSRQEATPSRGYGGIGLEGLGAHSSKVPRH